MAKQLRTTINKPIANTFKPIKPTSYWFHPLITTEITRRMSHSEIVKQARKFHAASCSVNY